MKRKRTRLPGPGDVDSKGLVTLQIQTEKGPRVVQRTSVDARELILHEVGSLDIDTDVQEAADAVPNHYEAYAQMGLDELREICKKNQMSYTGKPVSVMARMLADAEIDPEPYFDQFDEE